MDKIQEIVQVYKEDKNKASILIKELILSKLNITDIKEISSLSQKQNYVIFNLMSNIIESIEEDSLGAFYQLFPDLN